MTTQDTRAETATGPGGDYERLPYLSLPFAYSQPAHLAALAALHGLTAPAADSARVLELGCASGGNIVPLAARFPKARFLGLDLSERQIADGRRKIAALGLTNIELRQGDIAAVALPKGSFDYVICHGVYSWAPPAVQDAILRLSGDVLSEHGMAAVSYNVLPGWHLRSVLRDIFLLHAGKAGSPQDRVAAVRELLPKLAAAAQPSNPYGHLISHEAKLLAKMPSSYILGEFLADYNLPCTFQDFSTRASGHGLNYLCEADLGATARSLLKPDDRRVIAEMGGNDVHRTELYLDMFSGRPFRRSILVKPTEFKRIDPERLGSLHVSCNLKPNPAKTTDAIAAFTDGRGQTVSTEVSSISAALRKLAAAYPGSVAVAELAAEGRERNAVMRALVNLAAEGRATLSTLPLRVGRAADAKPKAWPLARAEAAAGLPGVTSLRHVTVALSKAERAIAAQLDGARDRIELTQGVIAAIERGELAGLDAVAGRSSAAVAAKLLDDTLQHLSDCAVLAAD